MAGAPKGNTNSKKENRLITDALKRVVVQNPDKLKKACEKVLDDAVQGNLGAFTVIADRLDGKPTQGLDVGIGYYEMGDKSDEELDAIIDS